MATVFIRSIILYLLLIVAIRFTGKRQIGELQPTELVLTILISNIAVMPIENTGVPILTGVVPIVTVVCLEVIFSFLASRFPTFDAILSGKPRIIVQDGEIKQKELEKLRLSPSDLLEQMRQKDIYDVKDTLLAIIETDGKTSFADKNQQQNLPKVQIIENGRLVKHFHPYCGIDPVWIKKILDKEGISIKDVFLMTCNKQKEYTIIRKETKK